MAQMFTLDAFLLRLPAPLDGACPGTVFEMAADEPELEDDDEDDDEDDEDEDEDEEDDDDEDEEDDDEDEDEDEEDVVEETEARTAHGQLKRQNGHRRGGLFHG
jgi:hypothetical protein